MSAITDPNRIKKDDYGNPDICMVYHYHQLFTDKKDVENICKECKAGKRGCVACKKELAKNIINEFKTVREKRDYYENHLDEVDKILLEGTKRAQGEAKKNIKRIKESMKLDYFSGSDKNDIPRL